MARGGVRYHVVHQPGRGIVHASARAARTEPPPPAGKRDQSLRSAVVAEAAAEAVLEDATSQEGLELLAHELGKGAVVGVGVGQKRWQVGGQYLVERGLLRLARTVLRRHPHGGAQEARCGPTLISIKYSHLGAGPA